MLVLGLLGYIAKFGFAAMMASLTGHVHWLLHAADMASSRTQCLKWLAKGIYRYVHSEHTCVYIHIMCVYV